MSVTPHFIPGDGIIDKATNVSGFVDCYYMIGGFNGNPSRVKYIIQWNGLNHTTEYLFNDFSEALNVWKKIDPAQAIVRIPGRIYSVPTNVNISINLDPLAADMYYGTVKTDGQCNHVWTEYQGFTENYKYCKKCDQKS